MWIIINGHFSKGKIKSEISKRKLQTSETILNLKYSAVFAFPVLQGRSPATG
jgi:hypothetical protein